MCHCHGIKLFLLWFGCQCQSKIFKKFLELKTATVSFIVPCPGLQRNGKSCRLRWINYLRPGLKRGMFTPQEDDAILSLHHLLGNKYVHLSFIVNNYYMYTQFYKGTKEDVWFFYWIDGPELHKVCLEEQIMRLRTTGILI